MRLLSALVAATVVTASAAAPSAARDARQASAQAVGPQRTFTPRDLFALQQAGDLQISPDGRRIAYVRTGYDIMTDRARRSVWVVDAATGAQTPLIPGAASSPRWSPDGRRIAYVAAEEGAAPQLYVRWLDSGASARITALPDSPSAISWSPDGRSIAFSMFTPEEGAALGAPLARPEGAKWAEPLKVITAVTYREDGEGYVRPGYDHLFVVSADGGSPRQLTFGKFDDGGSVSWTPDGRHLLFSSDHGPDRERQRDPEVFQVAVADGALVQLTHRFGPDDAPTASPDGRLIAYVGYDDKLMGYHNARLYVMDRDGGNSRVLTGGLDRSVSHPAWAADGRSIYVQYDDRGSGAVARVGLDGRVTTVATGLSGGALDRPYSGGGFSVSRTGVLAVTAGDGGHPADVALAEGPGRLRKLTALNDDLFLGKTLGAVTAHTVKSSADGLAVDYWTVTPPGFDPARKYPAILEIHGGPFTAYGPNWSNDDQLYAAAGYVVIYANPRGSTSYGDAFANQIHHNYPSHDYDDLMSVVDDAVAHGPVDGGHLFVTGGSGGGLLTAWIVGKTDRFKAAVAQKPVINWTSEVLTVDGYTFMAKYWFGKMPWEDPQGYWARSPLSLVGHVTTPTLVLVGQDDHRTPPSEAEQLYSALQLLGVPTGLIYVPGASHEGLAARPSQSAAKTAAILAWFDRHRDGPAAAAPARRTAD